MPLDGGDGGGEVAVALDDRTRWNARYRAAADSSQEAGGDDDGVRALLPGADAVLPRAGRALDLACGSGREALWLARRGLHVIGVDISEEALAVASVRALRHGVADRVTWVAADLDDGLPEPCRGPFDVIVACHFRSARLDEAVATTLAAGGWVVASRLSVVGRRAGEPGPDAAYLAQPGELASLAERLGLRIHHHEEADGAAALVAQRIGPAA